MQTSDYEKTWREMLTERGELVSRRTELENELIEIKNSLAHIDEIIDHLAPLAGMSPFDKSIAKLGLTDAIRATLRAKGEVLSPNDVRQRLLGEGYDFSGLTAPMASIYKILNRLQTADEILREKGEGGGVFYKWNGITDDEIPF